MNEIDTDAISRKKPLVPPEQQDSGTYIGLLLGGIILATGAIVLFGDLYSTFSTKGIDITIALIFRMALMLICAYGAISCLFALYRIASLNRMLSKKIGEEFEDFVLYTRPFIEEVIRQRLAVEKVMDKLEVMEKRDNESASSRDESQNLTTSKWWEFLFFVALLTNISIGLYVYLEAHPYEMVPYSVIILGIAWWILMAKYFGILFDPRSIYIPAFFIAFLPTASIVLRIILAPYQALFVVFLVLFFYVAATYYYYKYLTTGIPIFSITKFREEIQVSKKARAEKPAALEIEVKKESILEQMLSRVKKDRIERPVPQPVIKTRQETIAREISLKDIISSAIKTKKERIRLSFMNLIWPHVLCRNGRKISIAGFIMVSLGVVTIIAFPETYENPSLEAIFLGVMFMTAGYSLIWKTGKKVFTWLTPLYLIGTVMSLGSIIIFFHLLTLTSIEAEIQNIALVYIIGIFFLVVDILIGKKSQQLAAHE